MMMMLLLFLMFNYKHERIIKCKTNYILSSVAFLTVGAVYGLP